jgi:hypothetical protein
MGLILLIIVLFVVFGGSFGVYRGHRWGEPVGSLGLILLIIVIFLLFSGRF